MSNDNIISIKNASIFQQDTLVLKDIDLEISKNEFVYLIGKVGSGKSSLIKMLNAEIPLNNGTANVVGYEMSKIKRRQIPYLRRHIGVVFQDFQLLTDRNIKANLEFVLKATGWSKKNKISERIKEVLDKVGMIDKILKMPNTLSGGEQQRVVIARALLNNPPLILADEPTGNLDPETSEEIIKVLQEISKKECAVVVATHNYNLLKSFPSRTIKCENKIITEIDKKKNVIDFEII